jgi:hypothetical protein
LAADFDTQSARRFNGLQPDSAIITLTQQNDTHTTEARGAAQEAATAGAPEYDGVVVYGMPAARAADIDITPVMIDAGIDAYRACDREFDPDSQIVSDIYRAMKQAASAQPQNSARSLSRQSVERSHLSLP